MTHWDLAKPDRTCHPKTNEFSLLSRTSPIEHSPNECRASDTDLTGDKRSEVECGLLYFLKFLC